MNKLIVVITLLLVTGCKSTTWSVIDGSKSKIGDNNNYDVLITSIDGKRFFDTLKYRKIEPGFRYLQLTSTNPKVSDKYVTKPFAIMAKPCVKYFVTANQKNNNKNESDNWVVKVIGEEKIPSCEKYIKE